MCVRGLEMWRVSKTGIAGLETGVVRLENRSSGSKMVGRGLKQLNGRRMGSKRVGMGGMGVKQAHRVLKRGGYFLVITL
jgi:hypothetical protein